LTGRAAAIGPYAMAAKSATLRAMILEAEGEGAGAAMKRLIFDLDGVLAIDDPSVPYAERAANLPVVEKLRAYRAEGFEIVICSARNMRTFAGQLGKINAVTLPVIIDWLKANDIPFDEVFVGKPWCGTDGFYVDDRAVRPDEFLALSLSEIQMLVGAAPSR